MAIHYYQLIPSQRIRLVAIDCEGDDFSDLFRKCWRKLPLTARRSICAFWRDPKEREPLVELSDLWIDSKDAFAQVTNWGRELRFSASAFKVLPYCAGSFIVVHELAHVYQKALGGVPGGESSLENEDDANRIAKEWGFDDMVIGIISILLKTMPLEQACERLEQMRLQAMQEIGRVEDV